MKDYFGCQQHTRRRIFDFLIVFSLAYSIVVRFTGFFLAPNLEKIFLLATAMTAVGLVYFLLLEGMVRKLFLAAEIRQVIFGAILAVGIVYFLLPPLYFPESHSLEILPDEKQNAKQLVIESIRRIEMPGGEKLPVSASQIKMESEWDIQEATRSFAWLGDPQARISYARFMQAGVEIMLKEGPAEGRAIITWDGETQIVDLHAPSDGSRTLVLMPKLNWLRLGIRQKFLVGTAFITEYISCFAILTSLLLLPRLFVFRQKKIIFIIFALVLLIFPVVQILDPVVVFTEHQIESEIRTILKMPMGDIRKHHLLTIAKIDLSNRGIKGLEGVQYLQNLVSLNLRDNAITSIAPLEKLHKLRKLNLRGNGIGDILPLANLLKLESLNLRDNPIKDLSPIRNLSRIKDLNLSGINVAEQLDLLEKFPELIKLNLRNSSVSDITIVSELMARKRIQNDPIAGIKAELDIRDNPIPTDPVDGYASIRPYWENISLRAPFILPVIDSQSPPLFSHLSGFYKSEFWLELSSADPLAVIHFTLDGSEPTIDSPRYQKSLLIREQAGRPNKLSAIKNTSPIWSKPIGEVYKVTVVRAKSFYPDGEKSRSVTHTFFVDPSINERFSIPVVALNTNPDYFFDEFEGIYVFGSIGGKKNAQEANYYQRGGEWQRPAHIEVLDDSGKLLLSQDGGVSIHGASTRKYPQKSLRLYADMDYGQSDYFNTEIYPDLQGAVTSTPITSYKTLLLRNSGNVWNFFLFRDSFMQALVDPAILDIQASQPVTVFLNGEFWGIYDLREDMDANYLASHYQLNPQDIVILERDAEINHGKPGDQLPYQELLDFIAENDIQKEEAYHFVSGQMDINNFIDYQIAEIYSRNDNWPFDNIKYWRYKGNNIIPNASRGRDGKWRWLLFDLDTAFGIGLDDDAYRDDAFIKAEGEFLLRSLLNNAEFRNQFINRFADQLNTFYSPQRAANILSEMEATLAPEIQEHMNRWNIMNGSMQVWKNNLDGVFTFVNERPTYVRKHIADRFSLDGTVTLTFKSEKEKGHIRINTIDILPTTPGILDNAEWSGVYFKGVPITVSAIPEAGYRFGGWKNMDNLSANMELLPENDMLLEAEYIKID